MGAARRWGRSGFARLAVALIALLLSSFAGAAPASANRTQSTVFDPGGILDPGLSDAYRTRTIDRISSLGADTLRVLVPWRLLAPDPESPFPPAGFDGSDPADYSQRSFANLDLVVREATSQGLKVLLTPTGPAPNWASRSSINDHVNPDPQEFEQFVEALGTRYSGDCQAAACGSAALPRVSFWSVWNEPNLVLFLRPQYVRGRPVAGRIYRGLYEAARRGLRASGHGSDPVLIGETAPSRGAVSTPPIDFLRNVLCLDRSYRLRGSCSPISAAGWAQHPYTPGVPPWEPPPGRGSISIGSLGRLTHALRKAAAAGATHGRLPVYVTEFGIQSTPKPAKQFGVSQLRQVEYLGIAEYLLYHDSQVRSYGQYLMGDDAGNPIDHLTFDTGLRFADDKPKLSYSAFALPLVARRIGGGRVELWGHVRPGSGPRTVQLSYEDGNGSSGTLTPALTDPDGYFDVTAPDRPERRWRAQSSLPGGRQLEGPFIRAYRFPGPGR
jgi:hypothetical protein